MSGQTQPPQGMSTDQALIEIKIFISPQQPGLLLMKDLHHVRVIHHHQGRIPLQKVIRVLPPQGLAVGTNQLDVPEVAIYPVVAVQDHPDQVQVAALQVHLPEAEVAAPVEDNK